MPYITGSRLKAERAGKHLDELESEIEAFFDEHPYEYFKTLNPQNLDNYLYRFPPQPIPPQSIGPILGDIVHNLRSALDHIAWQLALLTTEQPYRRTAFPIFVDTSEDSVRHFQRLVQHVHADAIPIIEAVQPYHHPKGLEKFHFLWVLHSLWNADKHRLLTTVPHRISAPVFSGQGGSSRRLDDGTSLIDVPKSADPNVNLDPYIKRQIVFEIPGTGYRAEIERIRLMYHYIAHEVIPFFARYLPESEGLVKRDFGTVERYSDESVLTLIMKVVGANGAELHRPLLTGLPAVPLQHFVRGEPSSNEATCECVAS